MTLHSVIAADRPALRPAWNETRALSAGTVASAITLRQLRLFESVWRLKTISRASEECMLSQPAVSQSLAKLESLVGAHLFNRAGQDPLPTDFGQILYDRTVRMFGMLEAAILGFGLEGGEREARKIAQRVSRPQLRALSAMLEVDTFEQAGRELGRCHTAMYRAVRELENNLSRRLLAKSANGWTPTPQAPEFSRAVNLALREIDQAIEDIRSHCGFAGGKLVIGAMPCGGAALLGCVIDNFLQRYPAVEAIVQIDGAAELVDRLRAGEIDLLIGLLPADAGSDLATHAFGRTPYRVVGRQKHPLAGGANVKVEDLSRFPWVIGAEGSTRRAAYERLFVPAGAPGSTICTSALPAVRELLQRSDRLALMTVFELAQETGLAALPYGILGTPPSMGLMTRADWQPTMLQHAFIDIVRASAPGALHSASTRALPRLDRSTAPRLVH